MTVAPAFQRRHLGRTGGPRPMASSANIVSVLARKAPSPASGAGPVSRGRVVWRGLQPVNQYNRCKVLPALEHPARFSGWRLPAAPPLLGTPGPFSAASPGAGRCRPAPSYLCPPPYSIGTALLRPARRGAVGSVVARSRRGGGARNHGTHLHALSARAIPAGSGRGVALGRSNRRPRAGRRCGVRLRCRHTRQATRGRGVPRGPRLRRRHTPPRAQIAGAPPRSR